MPQMEKEIIGKVHSLESFGLVDGPGVRFVVFLQGCRMRCQYCHNPETWNMASGEEWSAPKLFERVYRYRRYWGNNGGLTVSGGEPLLQMEFVTELFRIAKSHGVHTALDTSGNPFSMEETYLERFRELMAVTDLVILDLKEIDEQKHRKLTGWTGENILQMARWLSEHGKDMWIRHVLVPGLTDDPEGLDALGGFISGLKTVHRVEILPYHTLGTFKWTQLGLEYPLEGVRTPTEEEVRQAEKRLMTDRYSE